MLTIALIFVTLLAGCATTTVAPPAKNTGAAPPIGTQASSPVGGAMFTQFSYLSRTGAVFNEEVSFSFVVGKVVANAGDTMIEAISEGQTLHCTTKNVYFDPLVGPWRPACFLDANSDGMFEKVRIAPGAAQMWSDLAPPIRYTKSEHMIPNTGSFKYELLYQGTSRGSLKLAYREFTDNLARPAFYQDLTYDLEPLPMTITFRTVRIEVHSADNNQIKYKILSQF